MTSPQDVLAFWIGEACQSPERFKAQHKKWFNGGPALDAELRSLFLPLLEQLSTGPAASGWIATGKRGRLAAIIVLDQFSRNIFRKTPRAFAQDALALSLCKDGLARGEDTGLLEAERIFLYLPLEHSEDITDQDCCVEMLTKLHTEARPGFETFTKSFLDYAREHRDAIRQFGRFPHRNAILGRESTPDELEWLAEGGGF